MPGWKKVAVNAQNISFVGRGAKIAMPHRSAWDGYCVWVPASLVGGGSHGYEYIVSLPDGMQLTAKKYGNGRYNRFDVIREKPLPVADFVAAFGGEYQPRAEVKKLPKYKQTLSAAEGGIDESLRDED